MYFPLGSPNILKLMKVNDPISQIKFNVDKSLCAVLTGDCVLIYNFKPLLLLVSHKRQHKSIIFYGLNTFMEWKSDSNYLVISTAFGYLLLYEITFLSSKEGPYKLDSLQLHQSTTELFKTFCFPRLKIALVKNKFTGFKITCITSSEDGIIISNSKNYLECYKWDLTFIVEYNVKLNFPNCFTGLRSLNFTSTIGNTFIIDMEFSSTLNGFSFVLEDGWSGFLKCAKLNLNQMIGQWMDLNDGTCTSVNDIFSLIAIGQKNSNCSIYKFNQTAGNLNLAHRLTITEKSYPKPIGPVSCLKWSPDGRVLAVAWKSGGISLWSTFGSLLMLSLTWDYGLKTDFTLSNSFLINSMDWSVEGYNLVMIRRQASCNSPSDSILILRFAKSPSSWNYYNNSQNCLYLQGEDRLYLYFHIAIPQTCKFYGKNESPQRLKTELLDSKQWVVVQMPMSYYPNWPIKYSCINHKENKIAIAGLAGLTHFSLATHKWTIFGNETQEKEIKVYGGLYWWKNYIVTACHNIPKNKFELRLYNSETALSNMNMLSFIHPSKVVLLNLYRNNVLTYGDDRRIRKYIISDNDMNNFIHFDQLVEIDMLFTINPSCIVGLAPIFSRFDHPLCSDYIIINISGQLVMNNIDRKQSLVLNKPLLIANSVENVWFPDTSSIHIKYISDTVWLYCGIQGMHLWFPKVSKSHSSINVLMTKHSMLSFQLKIYPLLILFQEGISVGVEINRVLQSSHQLSPISLPLCIIERSFEAYLPHIFRELIYLNLSSSALKIAHHFKTLPHFSHCLELLLLEILEKEAAYKTPLSDAKLPIVLNFIKEFPFYVEILVQCARKTELSYWPYLFNVAGMPSIFLNTCLSERKLETAAALLIILQNLEPHLCHDYAITLTNNVLSCCNWKLSKELFRFLKAIESGPSLALDQSTDYNVCGEQKFVPSCELTKCSPVPIVNHKNEYSFRNLYLIDRIIENHATKLLKENRLKELGLMGANLDFQLTKWLIKQRNLSAVIENFINAFKAMHSNFSWPYPAVSEVTLKTLEESGFTKLQQTPSNSGDSGYLSICTITHCEQSELTLSSQDIDERTAFTDADSLESHNYFDSLRCFPEKNMSHIVGTYNSEVLPKEKSLINLSKTELQLRYLFQVFLGAGCLQWAFLLAVILRDEIFVCKVINAAKSQEQTHEDVERLQKNFNELLQWCSNFCLGYCPFISTIQCKMVTLHEIIACKNKSYGSLPDLSIKSKSIGKHNNNESSFLRSSDANKSMKYDSKMLSQDNERFQCIVM